MKPDRTNYETWLVDYLDGNLDKERERDLLLFLDENPGIREELSYMLNYRITPSNEKYRDKSSLKKTTADISESQFEYLCVASSENDLGTEQECELEEIIAGDSEKRLTAELINRIKLVPPIVEYRYKSKLKKLTIPRIIFRYSLVGMSTAAAVLVMIIVLRKPAINVNDNQIATILKDTARNEIMASGSSGINTEKHVAASDIKLIKPGIKRSENRVDEVPDAAEPSSVITEIKDSAVLTINRYTSEILKIDYRKTVFPNNVTAGNSLVAMNIEPVKVNPDDDNPGLNERIARFFREKIYKTDTPEKGKLKAYEIADAGIKGLDKLFGWDMSLQKNKDKKGEVSSVYFSSRLIKFNAPVKKSEPSE